MTPRKPSFLLPAYLGLSVLLAAGSSARPVAFAAAIALLAVGIWLARDSNRAPQTCA